MGKSSINWPCSMAMLNNQRVYTSSVSMMHISSSVITPKRDSGRTIHSWANFRVPSTFLYRPNQGLFLPLMAISLEATVNTHSCYFQVWSIDFQDDLGAPQTCIGRPIHVSSWVVEAQTLDLESCSYLLSVFPKHESRLSEWDVFTILYPYYHKQSSINQINPTYTSQNQCV